MLSTGLVACRAGGGEADVRELVWGTPDGLRVATALARPAIDFVIAADCVYEVRPNYSSTPSVAAGRYLFRQFYRRWCICCRTLTLTA